MLVGVRCAHFLDYWTLPSPTAPLLTNPTDLIYPVFEGLRVRLSTDQSTSRTRLHRPPFRGTAEGLPGHCVVFAWSGVPTLNLACPRESWGCAQVRDGTRRVLEKIFQGKLVRPGHWHAANKQAAASTLRLRVRSTCRRQH
jgi:hypothetical protein